MFGTPDSPVLFSNKKIISPRFVSRKLVTLTASKYEYYCFVQARVCHSQLVRWNKGFLETYLFLLHPPRYPTPLSHNHKASSASPKYSISNHQAEETLRKSERERASDKTVSTQHQQRKQYSTARTSISIPSIMSGLSRTTSSSMDPFRWALRRCWRRPNAAAAAAAWVRPRPLLPANPRAGLQSECCVGPAGCRCVEQIRAQQHLPMVLVEDTRVRSFHGSLCESALCCCCAGKLQEVGLMSKRGYVYRAGL